jgi:hypothetical protein
VLRLVGSNQPSPTTEHRSPAGPKVVVTDLERTARFVFDVARKTHRPGESLQDALVRVLYTTSPEEQKAGVAAAWIRGDAEIRGVSEVESLLGVADRLFH